MCVMKLWEQRRGGQWAWVDWAAGGLDAEAAVRPVRPVRPVHPVLLSVVCRWVVNTVLTNTTGTVKRHRTVCLLF